MWTRPLTWMAIAWPAFLAACALELLVFAMVDPSELHGFGSLDSTSRQGIYTLAFFVFWVIAAAATGLAVVLAKPLYEASDRDVS
jgi:hypothetical protein